jgi:Na+-transporting NADH:ubiquinone oxidoreductase subunit NqrF
MHARKMVTMNNTTISDTTLLYLSDEKYVEYTARSDEHFNEELDFVIEILEERMTVKDYALVKDELVEIALDIYDAIENQTDLNPDFNVDELEIGTPVDISGPDGDFILRPTMPRVCYVCAGIGITPARSMVRWAIDTADPVNMLVLYGNRDLDSTAFREEFAALGSDKVRVVTVLSEPEPGWTGRTGHIDADVVREEAPDWHDRYFFVSGPPGVVASLRDVLLRDVGVMEEDLVSEQFPGYQ